MALIKCPNCGQTISDKATKCPKCGNVLKRQSEQSPKGNQNNKSVFFIVAAIVLVILCVAMFFILHGKNKGNMKTADSDSVALHSNSLEAETDTIFADTTTLESEDLEALEKGPVKDTKLMGLKGPVKRMRHYQNYEESESYYTSYSFDRKGMLTKTENEAIGIPDDWNRDGITTHCIYKNGKIIKSTASDVNGETVFLHYEYVEEDDNTTVVYRINASNNSEELALLLRYDNDGNLIEKYEYDYKGHPIAKVIEKPTPQETVLSSDRYGNWTKIQGNGYQKIRKFEYY